MHKIKQNKGSVKQGLGVVGCRKEVVTRTRAQWEGGDKALWTRRALCPCSPMSNSPKDLQPGISPARNTLCCHERKTEINKATQLRHGSIWVQAPWLQGLAPCHQPLWESGDDKHPPSSGPTPEDVLFEGKKKNPTTKKPSSR